MLQLRLMHRVTDGSAHRRWLCNLAKLSHYVNSQQSRSSVTFSQKESRALCYALKFFSSPPRHQILQQKSKAAAWRNSVVLFALSRFAPFFIKLKHLDSFLSCINKKKYASQSQEINCISCFSLLISVAMCCSCVHIESSLGVEQPRTQCCFIM